MSSDIKTWLREAASRHNNYRCDEAADRIEALEEALRDVVDYVDTCNTEHREAQDHARAVLKGKE